MDILEPVHHVLIIEDPSFERAITLDAATYSIGRHSSNDIVLSCQKTSRNHATLLRRTDVKTNKCSYWILDGDLQGNRSRNGIFINGKKSLVHELKPGDIIQFSGDAQAKYKTTSNLGSNLPDNSINAYPLNFAELSQAAGESHINKDTIINKDTMITPT
ncbi:MAG: FHA domain-containing protein, partial [Waterburya sp.]